MKKCSLCVVCSVFLFNAAIADSIKINPKTTNTQTDSSIEVGDSEQKHIQKQNKDYNFFIGASINGNFPLYSDYDLYNDVFGYGWGIDAGVRFRKDKYIYHPGIKFVFEKLYNAGEYDYTYYDPWYNTYTFNLDIAHTIYGAIFDNYIKFTNWQNGNSFFTVGIGYGKINSKYKISDFNTDVEDKGNTVILTLGTLSQFDNGLGITFDTKYFIPDNETVDFILTLELGLRYSF